MANVVSSVPAADLAFVQEGADPHAHRRGDGLTRLHVAAMHGLVEHVRRLIKQGAEVDAVTPLRMENGAGRTALHIAAGANQVEAARVLLDAGADVNRLAASSLVTPIYYTGDESAYSQMIKLLLERGTDPVWGVGFSLGWERSMPVKVPADYESKKVKQEYEKWRKKTFDKRDPGEMDEYGRTLMFLAVMIGEYGLAEKWVSQGADIDMKNRLMPGSLKSAKFAGMTALMAAVCGSEPRWAKDWIARGANVNARDHYGHNVLWVCVAQRHTQHIEMLVAAGADPRAADSRGVTAEAVALRLCDDHRIRLQKLGYGSMDPGVQAFDAVRNKDLASLEALIAQGLDVNAPVKIRNGDVDLLGEAIYGAWSYAGAVFGKSKEEKIVNRLVKAGARVKQVTDELIHVMGEKKFGLQPLLLKAGADLDVRDADGQTAVEREIIKGSYDGVTNLVKAGASLDAARGVALLREAMHKPGAALNVSQEERELLRFLRKKLGAQPVSPAEFYDAACVGDEAAVARCLKAGFSVNQGRDEMMRIRRENPDMADYVEKNGKPRDPIAFAALYSLSMATFKLLAVGGADMGAVNIHGERLMDDAGCREWLKGWGIKPVAAKVVKEAVKQATKKEAKDGGDEDEALGDEEAPKTSQKLQKLADKFDEELSEKLEERGSPVWAKKPGWQKVSKSAGYQKAVAELEKELGAKGEEDKDAYGVTCFTLGNTAAVRKAVSKLGPKFAGRGYLMLAIEQAGIEELQGVGLFAGPEVMDALAAFGTGSTGNVGSGDLIWFLKRLAKTLEVKVACLGRNSIDLEFPGKIPNADTLAAELYAFAPDIVDQGAGSIDGLSKQIAKRKRIRLEWEI